jgi:hypothetical protein
MNSLCANRNSQRGTGIGLYGGNGKLFQGGGGAIRKPRNPPKCAPQYVWTPFLQILDPHNYATQNILDLICCWWMNKWRIYNITPVLTTAKLTRPVLNSCVLLRCTHWSHNYVHSYKWLDTPKCATEQLKQISCSFYVSAVIATVKLSPCPLLLSSCPLLFFHQRLYMQYEKHCKILSFAKCQT